MTEPPSDAGAPFVTVDVQYLPGSAARAAAAAVACGRAEFLPIPDPLNPELRAALDALEGPGAPFKGIPGAHRQRSRLGEQIPMCLNCAQIQSEASDLP